jgi:hypothetical protein
MHIEQQNQSAVMPELAQSKRNRGGKPYDEVQAKYIPDASQDARKI